MWSRWKWSSMTRAEVAPCPECVAQTSPRAEVAPCPACPECVAQTSTRAWLHTNKSINSLAFLINGPLTAWSIEGPLSQLPYKRLVVSCRRLTWHFLSAVSLHQRLCIDHPTTTHHCMQISQVVSSHAKKCYAIYIRSYKRGKVESFMNAFFFQPPPPTLFFS